MNRRNPEAASAESERPVRIPVGYRNKMTVSGKDPDYEYRWVNDEPGRIDEFITGGWELVLKTSGEKVGHTRVDRPSEEGSYTSQVVNSFDGMKSFLMRIKKEWFEEDQKRHAEYIDERESSLSKNGGDYGDIKFKRD